jgi:hypothetical protein
MNQNLDIVINGAEYESFKKSVHATPIDRNNLAETELSKLFFAGEATSSKFPPMTHGAYLSGIREAAKIKSILN